MAINILVADDHPLFREAIVHLLKRSVTDAVTHETNSLEELKAILSTGNHISLLLLDLKLNDTDSIDGLLYIKKAYPALPVIVISAYDDQSVILDSLRYGASGFIPKHSGMDEIAAAIHAVLDGDIWFPGSVDMDMSDPQPADKPDFADLTATQLKVLTLLRDGKPSKEMADIMFVTEATIKAHLTEIYRKLHVHNRTQAVVMAKQLELPRSDMSPPQDTDNTP